MESSHIESNDWESNDFASNNWEEDEEEEYEFSCVVCEIGFETEFFHALSDLVTKTRDIIALMVHVADE